jgi:curli biogenesis system outer membrane secretion channel CsgG
MALTMLPERGLSVRGGVTSMNHRSVGFRAAAVLSVLCCALVCFGIPAEAKTRIAILQFQDNAGSGAPAAAITDMMTTEIFNTGLFTVVERSRLDAIGREQALGASGLVDTNTAVQVGRLLGVDALMTGSITEYKSETGGGVVPLPFGGVAVGSHTAYVTLDVRVINAQTGEVTMVARERGAANQTMGGVAYNWAVFGTGKTGGILGAATYKAVQNVVQKLRGIAAASGAGSASFNVIEAGARVLIDVGETNGGAKPGQYYAVFREGDVVKGLKGEILDVEKIYTALLVIREAKPKYSVCEIVRGATVRRGDKVEPYFGKPDALKLGE